MLTSEQARQAGSKGGKATATNHPVLCPLCGSLLNPDQRKATGITGVAEARGAKGHEALKERFGDGLSAEMSRRGKMGGRGNKKGGNRINNHEGNH